MSETAVAIEGLRFAWGAGPDLLNIPKFSLARGERLFLRGPSGSGKSTLLGLIAGVAAPSAGRVDVLGRDMAKLGSAARDRMRADHLGVIFQMFNLLPYL
ncbi:MAG: ATP-binding cassette domain-containing protein, partial [Pseudomonadota bacterium]